MTNLFFSFFLISIFPQQTANKVAKISQFVTKYQEFQKINFDQGAAAVPILIEAGAKRQMVLINFDQGSANSDRSRREAPNGEKITVLKQSQEYGLRVLTRVAGRLRSSQCRRHCFNLGAKWRKNTRFRTRSRREAPARVIKRRQSQEYGRRVLTRVAGSYYLISISLSVRPSVRRHKTTLKLTNSLTV